MENNRIAQPGENLPETREENMVTALYKECLRSATKLSPSDREALGEMSPDPLIQALFRDLKSLAYAEKDFIGRYSQIISDYIKEQQDNTHTELERERCQFLRVVGTYLLPKFAILARRAREKAPQRKEITLESIIDNWKRQFGEYKSLNTAPRIPIRKFNNATIGIGAINTTPPPSGNPATLGVPTIHKEAQPRPAGTVQKTPEPPIQQTRPVEQYTKTGTVLLGMQAYNPQDPPQETKAHEPVRVPSGAEIPLAQIGFGTTPAPPTGYKKLPTEPGIPAKESTAILPAIKDPTNPDVQARRIQETLLDVASVEEPSGPTIIDKPPREIPITTQKVVLPARQIRETAMYNNPKLTISQIYTLLSESGGVPPSWTITLRNLQEAMVESFKSLKAEIASSENFDEGLQQKTLQCIENAFLKVGDPQYRKRVIHEFYDLVKSTKRDPNKRQKIIQIFGLALSNRMGPENSITSSERIQEIHKKSGIKAQKKASSSAFTQAQEILAQTDLAEMPEDLKGQLQQLFTISHQKFGLNHVLTSGETPPRGIASMEHSYFELMCASTLNILREVDSKVGRTMNPSTWVGKTRKARQFVAKLKTAILAQQAIMEQLLYSEGFFVPEKLQKLNREIKDSLSPSHSQKSA